ALVDKCCRLFRREAEERDITFEAITPAEIPAVYADEEAVIRVLNNLIGNAFKFTPEGGTIRVSVEGGGRRAEQRGFVSVTVSDTGVGISLEDQEKVFGKFTQVGANLTDKPPGTGIGLAICREIVEESGGKIWVQSAPGEGSTFGFTLPLATAVEQLQPEEAEQSSR
ncbi:MAG: ATP-binding protein, partial [Candidatus Brocadiia bacterium]